MTEVNTIECAEVRSYRQGDLTLHILYDKKGRILGKDDFFRRSPETDRMVEKNRRSLQKERNFTLISIVEAKYGN